MNKCKACLCETDLFFCPDCGRVIEYPDFIGDNQSLKQQLDEYTRDLVQTASKNKEKIHDLVGKGVLADAVFRKYYEHVAYLQSLCAFPSISSIFDRAGASLFDIMAGFAEKCKRNECQIAVVGTIKAGKSMFLNAVLGQEIASTYPTPETAALTKFRYSDKGDYVKVTYYTEEEWEQLWKSVMASNVISSVRDDKEDFITQYKKLGADSIKKEKLNREPDVFGNLTFPELKAIVEKFSSAKHPEHFFAKEVEVGLTHFNVPKNVVFVDTPGLNDPVAFRSEITKRYISSANVVLLCLKAASAEIRADELSDISILFSEMRFAKDRLYIFATQYDIQDNFLDYWNKYTKPEFVKHLSGSSYFGSKETAENRIIPVSAWYYLLTQRAKLDRNLWAEGSEYELELCNMVNKCLGVARRQDPEDRFYDNIEKIENSTNVGVVNRIILEGPVKEAESIIVNDLKKTYMGICDEISDIVQSSIEIQTSLLGQSRNTDVYDKIKQIDKKVSILNENHNKNIKIVNDALAIIESHTKEIINKIK